MLAFFWELSIIALATFTVSNPASPWSSPPVAFGACSPTVANILGHVFASNLDEYIQGNAWATETLHRNSPFPTILKNNNDCFILSDCDEIPEIESLNQFKTFCNCFVYFNTI